MLFLPAIIAIIFVGNVLGVKDQGQYYELDGTTTKAYLFIAEDDCSKVYICKQCDDGWWFTSDDIYDCYLRSEHTDKKFGPGDRDNPGDCKTKGYVNVQSEKCYFTNTGTGGETYNKSLSIERVPYYDIDWRNKRALTEYGWCTFGISQDDVEWITNIKDDNIKINQINFPGTHDSGTYAIQDTGINIWNVRSVFGRTQEVNIYEQMMNGIRYFDIRVETNKNKEIYLTHNQFDCMNRDTGKKYYLSNVFDEAVEFLGNHPKETIIIHLKDDNIIPSSSTEYYDQMHGSVTTVKVEGFDSYRDVYKAIADISIFNTDSTDFSKPYNKFFFNEKELFPKLSDVRGKVVLLTRGNWKYNDTDNIGNELNIPGMGDCTKYPDSDKEDEQKCYPHIHDKNKHVLVQDNYNLFSGKSDLVQNLLDHKIPIFFNKTEYSKDDELTNSFYESKNEETLTIDFMNIQAISLKAISNSDSIESIAYRMNQFLSKYIKEDTKFHNHWFVLDYPTNDLVRKIYTSIDSNTLNKRNEITNVVQIDDFVIYTDFDYYIVSAENACLQRKTKNKWRIIPKNNYYNIKSSYDAKCLSYSKSRLSMSYCDDSQNKQFSIKNGKFCSRSGNYCLDSKFQIQPTIIKPIRYEYLTCSSNYLKAGYKCCRNQYAKVEKVDDIGNWAKENGEWCGIGYERCSFDKT